MSHISSTYDVETIEIAGRDGALLVDNQRLKPVEQPFPFIVKPKNKKVSQVAGDLSNWLGAKGYQDFEKSWDSGYLYRATFLETFELDEVISQFGHVQLVFLFHPIKYLKSEQKEITVTNGQTILNKGNVPSNPIIKLTGSGDTTLTINGRQTILKGIQGGLIWNAERKLVYKGNFTSQWGVVVAKQGQYNAPMLDIGANVISWTGNFAMKMITNGGVKI